MDSLGPSHGGIEMTVEVRVSLESKVSRGVV